MVEKEGVESDGAESGGAEDDGKEAGVESGVGFVLDFDFL